MTSLVWCCLLLNLTKWIWCLKPAFFTIFFLRTVTMTTQVLDSDEEWLRALCWAGTHTKCQFLYNVAFKYMPWHKRHNWKCWSITRSDMRSLCQHILVCFLPSYMLQDYSFTVAIPFPEFLYLERITIPKWILLHITISLHNSPDLKIWTVFFQLM